MLYVLNKADDSALHELAVLGAKDDEKSVLFILDGVFMATASQLEKFDDLDVGNFYAMEEAVEKRVLTLDGKVELVDYDDMAELCEDADKIIFL